MREVVLLSASALALALCACSAQGNEGACKDFESAYNASGLRYNQGTAGSGGATDYGKALKKLADAARVGIAKASGEVKKNLQDLVDEGEMYSSAVSSQNSPYTSEAVRTMADNSRDGLFDACEAAGMSIHLGPVNAGQ
ncbi:hypothetical protein QF031_001861 [Pseudarthrobacter defluvii]|uniref:hypothetical protein n=1 Tax=Pseudarthrobacter defluvii TaxID=410837 RepID=UPI00277E0794|nr:hypothetical protein [Pseudarthrobacter defluvii]MDQ0769112.1 hypothetical protein [Pseudarthrobacter defluvii]